MKYYRIEYDGYTEGEYESPDAAIKDFIELAQKDFGSDMNITVKRFNEKTNQWEDV